MNQMELFPELITLEPTIACRNGDTYIAQCSWCGTLLCASRKIKLGPCPACNNKGQDPNYHHSWWEQEGSTGPFKLPRD